MPNWERFGHTWDQLGRKNALGAILTVDGKVADWNIGELLATGRIDVGRFMPDLERLSPSTPRTRLLDFGCGVGRVTRVFSQYFDQVVGVDVAPSMIARAREVNADSPACTFVLNRSATLDQLADGSFDVVYCRLVLQHIRPAIVRGYIREFVRLAAPGGVIMFQLPEVVGIDSRQVFIDAPVAGSAFKQRLPRWLIEAWRRLKYRVLVGTSAQIEMFGMARPEVEALIQDAGGRLLTATPDRSHGEAGSGWEYWVTRGFHEAARAE